MENWKDIQGYEGYQVSNLGNVKSLNYHRTGKEQILKSAKKRDGYLEVSLCKNGRLKHFKVHRLVAMAFIANPNHLPEVNHIDEDKTNNRVENLEWCTKQYNINYGTGIKRSAKARTGKKQSQEWIEKAARAKYIPIVQLDLQGNFIAVHNSAKEVERELGFYRSNISRCCKGKYKTANGYRWQYLSDYQKAI